MNAVRMMEALGLPPLAPEPEVLAAMLADIRARSLARVVADLINNHEPLLKAEADDACVTVREMGGGIAMRFTISEAK